MFFVLGNFIWARSALGWYGLVLESNEEIYQELFEPLFKELKVGDDSFHKLQDANSNLVSLKRVNLIMNKFVFFNLFYSFLNILHQ